MKGSLSDINAPDRIVSRAGRESQPIVILDLSKTADPFVNPYLPETRSQAAIPMIVQDELVGILDLQSARADGFHEDDIHIMITLAEQIGVAIQNARLYQEQVRVAAELRKVDEMKMQFLSSMSHELRTPLNATINFVEMVSMGLVGPVTDKQIELLENSLQSSRHLLHLINDVLDISKIQAGKLTLFVEDLNLYQEIDTVLGMAASLLKDKPVKLVLDIDNDLPLASGDKRRIRQVLLNLLTNAAKFTPAGTITLSVKHWENDFIFAVIDTGPGIAKDLQEIIFEPFVQTADGIKQIEGTGLGLPISRSLVKAHGGNLWVESHPGDGAAFYFTLPGARQSNNENTRRKDHDHS
jgi:signal transduction histidine kinase